MNLEDKFKKDFIEKFSKDEYSELEEMFKMILEDENLAYDSDDFLWNYSVDVEKHNQLQYTYYINFYKEDEDEDCDIEVNVEYENGINNGTLMRGYCLEGGGLMPAHREVRVLSDIEFNNPKLGETFKDKLLEVYKKREYDSCMTGELEGLGFLNGKGYGKHFIKMLLDKGLKWKLIYTKEKIDINLI